MCPFESRHVSFRGDLSTCRAETSRLQRATPGKPTSSLRAYSLQPTKPTAPLSERAAAQKKPAGPTAHLYTQPTAYSLRD